MPYGQPTATRFQKTTVNCVNNSWTKLEGSTELTNRVGTELFVKSQAAINKLYITYSLSAATPTDLVESCIALETGSYHFVANGPGLTLWGRTDAGRGKVIVTEFAA